MSKYGTWARGQDEALLNILGGQEVAERIIAREVRVKIEEIEEALLDFIGTTTISATTTQFVAKEYFVIDTSHKAKVKIGFLGSNFEDWFLSGDGKIEAPIEETTLQYAKFRKSSKDKHIIADLGGEGKAETTLTELFSLLEKQGSGEDGGPLLTNGYANIFYICDRAGVLRTVSARWSGGGWRVDAYSVEFPLRWNDGSRVFSRNS